MVRPYTWDQLAQATLHRQFPRIRGRGASAVVELLRRVGPVQSQVARAPFLTVASRLPGATYGAIAAAYESLHLVRGSNLRGTVHTCIGEQHAILDAVTRSASEGRWRRILRLDKATVSDVQSSIEEFATGAWHTPQEFRDHLTAWLGEHETSASVEASHSQAGRFTAIGHSGLVRRPLTGGWERQTAPGYRLAAEVLGEDRERELTNPGEALTALVRIHLRAFGPASRDDIAWWSGVTLRRVDAALEALGDELTARPGPRDLTYVDLVDAPRGGLANPGIRLLPEYDGLLLGYHPKSRDRFVDPGHLRHFWASENGAVSAVVLVGGRLGASWRLRGQGRERDLKVTMFPGVRPLVEAEFAEPVQAVEQALDIKVRTVTIGNAGASRR